PGNARRVGPARWARTGRWAAHWGAPIRADALPAGARPYNRGGLCGRRTCACRTSGGGGGAVPDFERATVSAQRQTLDVPALETWLWDAACQVRGPLDAPKFKDYILPLVFLKRLSDVFDDEVSHLAQEFGDAEVALRLVEEDHKLVRFFLPPSA